MFMPASVLRTMRNRSLTYPAPLRASAAIPHRVPAVALRSLTLGIVTLLLIVASAQSCPTPPSGEWFGNYHGEHTFGTWQAPSVTVYPETYLGSETFEFTDPSGYTASGFSEGDPEALTGGIIPMTGYVKCNGHLEFQTQLTGTIERSAGHYEDVTIDETITGTFRDTEVSGSTTETYPALEYGTWSGNAYAAAVSQGFVPGQVELKNPPNTWVGSSFSVVSADDPTLPPGAVNLVGAVSFEISGVPSGGIADVNIVLPPGSNPTEAYKWTGSEYELYPLSKTKVDGRVMTLELTDNAVPWDQNPAPGTIADPVIPVNLPTPSVEPKGATAVTETTTTLNATVGPHSEAVTECKFEYGTTDAYGKTASCASPPKSQSTPVAVSASLAGLTANTTYHFRISASNSSGTSTGEDQTFTTLPSCTAEGFCASFTLPPSGEPTALAVGTNGLFITYVADGARFHDRVLGFGSNDEYLAQRALQARALAVQRDRRHRGQSSFWRRVCDRFRQ